MSSFQQELRSRPALSCRPSSPYTCFPSQSRWAQRSCSLRMRSLLPPLPSAPAAGAALPSYRARPEAEVSALVIMVPLGWGSCRRCRELGERGRSETGRDGPWGLCAGLGWALAAGGSGAGRTEASPSSGVEGKACFGP